MKTKCLLSLAVIVVGSQWADAQGTAFTYQGRLNDGANPANGSYDIRFYLRDALTAGNAVGTTNTIAPVFTSNGLFNVTLDFGANFPGAARWLEIGVRTNGSVSAYTTLAPRQPLLPTPYAITASNLTGTLSATQLTGTLPSSQLGGTYSSAIALNNAGNSFTGDGAGLTSVNALTLGGLSAPNFWQLNGNNVSPGQFLGSTNNQTVEIKVNNLLGFRIEPTVGIPNVIGGASDNFASSVGIFAGGSFIGGGSANTNGARGSVIGGGFNNLIQSESTEAVIGGGGNNTIGLFSHRTFIGGGSFNAIGHDSYGSSIAGGFVNSISNYTLYGSIGGGTYNAIKTNSDSSTIAGGYRNIIGPSAQYAMIAGGYSNVVASPFGFAAGHRAEVYDVGGFVWADSQSAEFYTTTSNQFLVRASGGVAINTNRTLEGGLSINSSTYLLDHPVYLRGADGVADHNHGLAYCGNAVNNFASTVLPDGPVLWGFGGGALGSMNGGAHSVLLWTNNGVAINTNNPGGAALYVQGNRTGLWGQSVGWFENNSTAINPAPALRVVVDNGFANDGALSVSANGGGYIARFGNIASFVVAITNDGTIYAAGDVYARGVKLTSDRNAKENFTPLDSKNVLAKVAALPVSEWKYKNETGVRHIGPVAQDFQAAFQLSADDTHISTVDEGGVALAAIQGLNDMVKEKDTKISALEERVGQLERLVNQLAEKSIR